MLNHKVSSMQKCRTVQVLPKNTEPWMILPKNAEPWIVLPKMPKLEWFCLMILNYKKVRILKYANRRGSASSPVLSKFYQ